MARRTARPFTVEVRSLREKPGKKEAAKASRSQPDEALLGRPRSARLPMAVLRPHKPKTA